MKHLKYARYVFKHKFFVFRAGLKTGAPLWRLIIHDWSKFLPDEWFPYAEFFYGKGKPGREAMGAYSASNQKDQAFLAAWLRHQNRQSHHWQYWILLQDNADSPGKTYGITAPDGVELENNHIVDFRTQTTDPDDFLEIAETGLKHGKIAEKRYALMSRLVRDANRTKILPMPEKCVREMVADWMGAGRAITGKWDISEWYERNKNNMLLHSEARTLAEKLIKAGHP